MKNAWLIPRIGVAPEGHDAQQYPHPRTRAQPHPESAVSSFSNSVTLFKSSLHVLKQDKELLVYPILSSISMVLVVASFVLPIAVTGSWTIFEDGGGSSNYLAYVVGFLFYLVQYTVIFFFNTALVGAAIVRLNGGDPTVSTGLNIAIKRLPTILGYAAISATVGMILRVIAERSGFLGRIVAGLLGVGWSLTTYLAVPILVTRDLGAIDTVKESAGLFRKTWGEQVISNFGFGWIGVLAGISWSIVWIAPVILLQALGPAVLIPLIAVGILGYLVLGLVLSALKGIYTAALYQYATEGTTEFFDEGMMGGAFRQK